MICVRILLFDMTNKLSVNRSYKYYNIEGTDSAITLKVSQGLQEGGPEGADPYVSKVMDQRNPQVVSYAKSANML